MRAWRNMKTAPRDGTPVLVRCSSGVESYRLVAFIDGEWMELGEGLLLSSEGVGSPTHWCAVPGFRGRAKKPAAT